MSEDGNKVTSTRLEGWLRRLPKRMGFKVAKNTGYAGSNCIMRRKEPENRSKFKDGWARGSMKCRRCQKVFTSVEFRYSCHDKVEGEWPKCCGELAKFENDWIEIL